MTKKDSQNRWTFIFDSVFYFCFDTGTFWPNLVNWFVFIELSFFFLFLTPNVESLRWSFHAFRVFCAHGTMSGLRASLNIEKQRKKTLNIPKNSHKLCKIRETGRYQDWFSHEMVFAAHLSGNLSVHLGLLKSHVPAFLTRISKLYRCTQKVFNWNVRFRVFVSLANSFYRNFENMKHANVNGSESQ